MFAWASPQDLMFLQTTVMSKVDMCTKRCTSRSRMLVAAVRGREGGGFITSQHSCQTDNLSLCNTTGCRITRDVFQPFLWWQIWVFFMETWRHFQLFLWWLKPSSSHRKSDHLHPLAWITLWCSTNKVVLVHKPNRSIGTALRQERREKIQPKQVMVAR